MQKKKKKKRRKGGKQASERAKRAGPEPGQIGRIVDDVHARKTQSVRISEEGDDQAGRGEPDAERWLLLLRKQTLPLI